MNSFLDIVFSFFLGAILLTAIISYNIDLTERSAMNNMVLSVQQTGLDVQQILSADIANAGLGVSDSTNCFILADSTQLKFRSDIGLDGTVNEIHYYLGDSASAGQTENEHDRLLYRKIDSQNPEAYSIGLTGLTFTYYDSTGTQTAVPGNIYQVKMAFTLENTFSYNGKTGGFYYEKRIQPKNIIR